MPNVVVIDGLATVQTTSLIRKRDYKLKRQDGEPPAAAFNIH
jgi:hypothetical protein